MTYGRSSEALFHPEWLPPLPMDRTTWTYQAIAAEVARLAYFRIETRPTASAPVNYLAQVNQAMDAIGYEPIEPFFARSVHPLMPDTQGFGTINADRHAIISFRGTQPDSLADILGNVVVPRIPWDGFGHVHLGFWESLRVVLRQVRDWLDKVEAISLTITGHSLGGALATLLAGLYHNAQLITFGSPRVGDRTFVASLERQPVQRYVDNTDIVTHLPTAGLLDLGYHHTGGLHLINAVGSVQPLPDDRDDGSLLDVLDAIDLFLVKSWDREPLPRWLTDHAPINYIAALHDRAAVMAFVAEHWPR